MRNLQTTKQGSCLLFTLLTVLIVLSSPIALSSSGTTFNDIIKSEENMSGPKLTIESITGGYDAHAMITNIGDEPATNITWRIDIDGDFVILSRGPIPPVPVIPELAAGESIIVTSWRHGFLFGFGNVNITVSAFCQEDSTAEESVDAMAFTFFIGIN